MNWENTLASPGRKLSNCTQKKKKLLLKKRAGSWPRLKHDVQPSRRPVLLPGLKDLPRYPAATKHSGWQALEEVSPSPLLCDHIHDRGPWLMSRFPEAEEGPGPAQCWSCGPPRSSPCLCHRPAGWPERNHQTPLVLKASSYGNAPLQETDPQRPASLFHPVSAPEASKHCKGRKPVLGTTAPTMGTACGVGLAHVAQLSWCSTKMQISPHVLFGKNDRVSLRTDRVTVRLRQSVRCSDSRVMNDMQKPSNKQRWGKGWLHKKKRQRSVKDTAWFM